MVEESHRTGAKRYGTSPGSAFLILRQSQSAPTHAPREAGAVKPGRIVLGHAREQQLRFPGRDWCLKGVELLQNRQQTLRALHAMLGREPLPFQEETQL